MKKLSTKKVGSKLISLGMALVMVVSAVCNSSLAITAHAYDENPIVIVETNRVVKIREEASKYAEVVVEVPEKTLMYVNGSVVNSAGNVWFEVSYFGDTKYVFSEEVNEHFHIYEVPVTTEDGSYECYACKCGAVECNPNGLSNIVAPVIAAASGVGALFGDELIVAGVALTAAAMYGVAQIGEYMIPIIVNAAGAFNSLSLEEFKREVSKYEKETGSDSEKCYYPATIMRIEGQVDTVTIVNYSSALSLDEACTYLDGILAKEGVFGHLKDFQKEVDTCNIYTTTKGNAEKLCNKIIACPANCINTFGDSKGVKKYEQNSAKHILGTYRHFHLHNRLDNTLNKSVVHILFDKMLTIEDAYHNM